MATSTPHWGGRPRPDLAQLRGARTERCGIRRHADTGGDYVAFAKLARPLRKTAVHMGLALPNQVQFFRGLGETRYRERERSLPALEPR